MHLRAVALDAVRGVEKLSAAGLRLRVRRDAGRGDERNQEGAGEKNAHEWIPSHEQHHLAPTEVRVLDVDQGRSGERVEGRSLMQINDANHWIQ
jgi:hypothetical protein